MIYPTPADERLGLFLCGIGAVALVIALLCVGVLLCVSLVEMTRWALRKGRTR